MTKTFADECLERAEKATEGRRDGEKQMKKDTKSEPQITHSPVSFTGIARSVQAYDNQGFRNFRVMTLHVEHGIVVKIDYSDPYASFEAMDRMDYWNGNSVLHLNNTWEHGKALEK